MDHYYASCTPSFDRVISDPLHGRQVTTSWPYHASAAHTPTIQLWLTTPTQSKSFFKKIYVQKQLQLYTTNPCIYPRELTLLHTLLYEFNVVGWEESIRAVQLPGPSPPTRIKLLNAGDDLVDVKRQLTIILCVYDMQSEKGITTLLLSNPVLSDNISSDNFQSKWPLSGQHPVGHFPRAYCSSC